jgi:endonuclease/exonuclease/phosphatase family metal-dependent hydrolase
MTESLHITTYNIHKGFSNFNRRMVLHEVREQLRHLKSDLIFLQEVHGAHEGHGLRHENYPQMPQYEFLADSVWSEFRYGKNAVYDEGHHGNAILSRFPIISSENEDVSAHAFESRGLLHCVIAVAGWKEWLHAVCVHFGLTAAGRRKQIDMMCDRIERMVPPESPLVIAGDFNDWQQGASRTLRERLNVREVFELTRGRPARSFPSSFPLLRLDRIYVRGVRVSQTRLLAGQQWARLSDHSALSARVSPL